MTKLLTAQQLTHILHTSHTSVSSAARKNRGTHFAFLFLHIKFYHPFWEVNSEICNSGDRISCYLPINPPKIFTLLKKVHRSFLNISISKENIPLGTKTQWGTAGWKLPVSKNLKSWNFSHLETKAQVSGWMPIEETGFIQERRG